MAETVDGARRACARVAVPGGDWTAYWQRGGTVEAFRALLAQAEE